MTCTCGNDALQSLGPCAKCGDETRLDGADVEGRMETKQTEQTKHTPGPWRVTDLASQPIIYAGEMRIADVRGWGFLIGTGRGGQKLPAAEAVSILAANANLIAAAPDLLEALATMARQHEDECGFRCECPEQAAAIAAIAKAEGRS